MTRPMRWRLLPDSVFGRFLTVLIVCCALAQFVAVALVIKRSASWTAQWEYPMADEAARRMLDIILLLQTLQPEQRIAIVEQRNSRPIEIDLAGPVRGGASMAVERPPPGAMGLGFEPPAEPMRTSDTRRFAAVEKRSVQGDPQRLFVPPPVNRHRFGDELGRRIKLRLDSGIEVQIDAGEPEPGLPVTQAGDNRPSPEGVSDIATVNVRWPNEPALTFHIGWPKLAPLSEGHIPDFKQVIGSRLAFQLLILLIGLSVGAYLAARRIARPLSRLATAADALGRSLNQPPLPETGARELRQVAQAFNVMQDRLRRHIGSRTRVVAAMSHDLRTPLTRMRLMLQRLEDGSQREELELNMAEMESMVVATLDALANLAIEEAHQEVDINELLVRLRTEFADLGHHISIRGAASGSYMARPQALKRCLANLIDNAIKYGDVATIRVSDGDCLRIVVADRGPGIPQQELERVFEPFYRLESSRSGETGGTGLGLSVARDCAQAHGGHLILRNGLEGGLEAELTLPRNPA